MDVKKIGGVIFPSDEDSCRDKIGCTATTLET